MSSATILKAFSDIRPLLAIARTAGREIMALYQKSHAGLSIEVKEDDTPVTQADLASHDILVQGLTTLTPEIPILSEEGASIPFATRQSWVHYWCIDPLDGTKEFIARTDEFCICIALMEQQQPILSVIHLPVSDMTFYATLGGGAFQCQADHVEQAVQCRTRAVAPNKSISIAVSRRHTGPKTQAVLKRIGQVEVNYCGSAIKFAKIAQGQVDIYPSTGQTKAWDTAAGQLLLTEAGGQVMDFSGNILRYNQHANLENPPFIAVGDPSYPWLDLLAD